MKKTFFHLMIFLGISFLTGCTPLVHHADPFYDINTNDFPLRHLPLINPVEAVQIRSSDPWILQSYSGLDIPLPKSREQDIQTIYTYRIEELDKIAVQDGVIMAYSAYVDEQADPYIRKDYYHWFVFVPSKDITKGFHTEDEFRRYIQTLGIQNPDWQTPDEAYGHYLDTGGCLDWIPDCQGKK